MSFDVNVDIRKAIEDAKKPIKDKSQVIIPPPLHMNKDGCWKTDILFKDKVIAVGRWK